MEKQTDESKISALIYGTLNQGLLRENGRDGMEIFLSDCDSLTDAKEKLKEQKKYVDKTIATVATLNWENVVKGACNVVEMERAYSKTVNRVTSLRNSIDSSKNMLTSLPRNIRQLYFEQYEYKYALEMIEKIKECEELYSKMLNENVMKDDFKKLTAQISAAYNALNEPKYEKLLLKKELKSNLKDAANLLIDKIDKELSILLYSRVCFLDKKKKSNDSNNSDNNNNNNNVNDSINDDDIKETNDNTETLHCKEIRILSSYIYKLLISTNDNTDNVNPHERFSELNVALNAQTKFNNFFLMILYKYNAKSINDVIIQGDNHKTCKVYNHFYYFVHDLMKICEIYMERFWHFYIGGSLQHYNADNNNNNDDDITIDNYRNLVANASNSSTGPNNTLMLLWYTVQTDLISILRRHFEEEVVYVDNSNIRPSFQENSSNNLNSPEAIVSRTLDNWFTNNDGSEMSFYIHERVDEWPESTSLIGGKKRSSSVQDSISQIVPFDQLFVCPPSPYNAVEISTLVNKIAKKIDHFVHNSMKKTSSTPSRKKRHSRTNLDPTSYKRADSAIETIVPFIQSSRDFLFNCIKTDVIKDVVTICDSPSALDRLQIEIDNNSTTMTILSSSNDVIRIFENWIHRFCFTYDINNSNHKDQVDELLLNEVIKSIDVGIERYLKWCKRMFTNDWNEKISKKRIAKYNNVIFLPETGYEIDMEKFLHWVLDHIVHDGESHNSNNNKSGMDEFEKYNQELIQLSKKLNRDQRIILENDNKSKAKLSTQTLSLLEIYLMEDQYFNNVKYMKKFNENNFNYTKGNEEDRQNINIAMDGNSTNPENLNIQTKNSDFTGKNQLELNEKNIIPIVGGLDTLACFHTSLKYIKNKMKMSIIKKVYTVTNSSKEKPKETIIDKSNDVNLIPSLKNIDFHINECLFLLRTNLRIRCYWRLNDIVNDFHFNSNKDINNGMEDDYNMVYHTMQDNISKENNDLNDDDGTYITADIDKINIINNASSSILFPSVLKLCDDIYSFVENVLPLLENYDDKSCHFVLGGLGTLIGTSILNQQLHLTYKICGEDLMNSSSRKNSNSLDNNSGKKNTSFKKRKKHRKHDKKKRQVIWKQIKEALNALKRSFVNNRHDNKLILIDQIKSELLHAEKVLDLIGLKLDRNVLEQMVENDLQFNYYDKKLLYGLFL